MKFTVNRTTKQVTLEVHQTDASANEVLNDNHLESFPFVSKDNMPFYPTQISPKVITGDTNVTISITYSEIPDDDLLIMKFKDPRGERNPKLFIIIDTKPLP